LNKILTIGGSQPRPRRREETKTTSRSRTSPSNTVKSSEGNANIGWHHDDLPPKTTRRKSVPDHTALTTERIADYLQGENDQQPSPATWHVPRCDERTRSLRRKPAPTGPVQRRKPTKRRSANLVSARQHQPARNSPTNNLPTSTRHWRLHAASPKPAAAVIKTTTTPCGAATSDTLDRAGRSGRPVTHSARFGSVVGIRTSTSPPPKPLVPTRFIHRKRSWLRIRSQCRGDYSTTRPPVGKDNGV